jgi:hypothetical protein
MREFTTTEYNIIQHNKPKCNKKVGETCTFNSKRYTKTCVAQLPGTWMKTDDSLKFEIEITPDDQPNTLHFRISGCVPGLVDGKPSVCWQDIIDTTVDYSVDRHQAYFYPPDDPQATERVLMEVPVDNECATLIARFFLLAENVCRGYGFLMLALKQGYRFTGVKEWSAGSAYYHVKPEDFLK